MLKLNDANNIININIIGDLNTSHVKVKLCNHHKIDLYLFYLNTSHVKVKQDKEQETNLFTTYLNTSHVKVKQIYL